MDEPWSGGPVVEVEPRPVGVGPTSTAGGELVRRFPDARLDASVLDRGFDAGVAGAKPGSP